MTYLPRDIAEVIPVVIRAAVRIERIEHEGSPLERWTVRTLQCTITLCHDGMGWQTFVLPHSEPAVEVAAPFWYAVLNNVDPDTLYDMDLQADDFARFVNARFSEISEMCGVVLWSDTHKKLRRFQSQWGKMLKKRWSKPR